MGLTTQQGKFICEYLKDPNATQAAIRAGYSKKTAYSIGPRLLKHPEILGIISHQRVDGDAKVADAVDHWHEQMNRLALVEVPTDDFKYDHKLRALDMLAKAEGRYAVESAGAAAFAIQINLGHVVDDD